MTTKDDYDRCCEKIKRWKSRLKRAMTMIDKLERQKLRLDRKLTREQVEAEVKQPALSESCDHIASAMIQGKSFEQASDDLAIPSYLQRKAEGEAKDKAAADAIRQELATQQEAKRRKSNEKARIKKEVRQADLTGKTRRMPLSGKEALKAIRG